MFAFTEKLRVIWHEAATIWLSGGPAMIGIAVIALVMFAVGMNIHLKLRRTGFLSVPERTWRSWLDAPEERRGSIGRLIGEAMSAGSLRETATLFEHLRKTETAPFERDLRVMKVCVSAAPLVGLLGTVTGMLATFGALSSGSGGEKTMSLVAGGISEALITTETGLVIALPGLFFQYRLGRLFERYKAFLAHLETVCAQVMHRRQGRPGQGRTSREEDARRAAAARIAQALRVRLREGKHPAASPPAPPATQSTSGPSPALQTSTR